MVIYWSPITRTRCFADDSIYGTKNCVACSVTKTRKRIVSSCSIHSDGNGRQWNSRIEKNNSTSQESGWRRNKNRRIRRLKMTIVSARRQKTKLELQCTYFLSSPLLTYLQSGVDNLLRSSEKKYLCRHRRLATAASSRQWPNNSTTGNHQGHWSCLSPL